MKSKRKIVKLLFFVGLVLVFALSLVSYSEAQKNTKHITLEGNYGVIGYDTCIGHWIQNPNPNAVYDTHWTNTSTIRGIVTFNSDGTGRSDVKRVTITHPIYTPIPSASFWTIPLSPNFPLGANSVSVSNISSEFNYEIYQDRAIARHITSWGQFVYGPRQGKFISPMNVFTLTGFISSDMQTIIESSPVNDPIEQAEYTSPVYMWNNVDPTGYTGLYAIQEQTCQRTRILTLISK